MLGGKGVLFRVNQCKEPLNSTELSSQLIVNKIDQIRLKRLFDFITDVKMKVLFTILSKQTRLK